MSLGEKGDFRTTGFKQVLRFPGQGARGGDGSAFLPSLTPPVGTSNSISPVPPLTLPVLGTGTFNFPSGSLGLPGMQFPTITPFLPSAGEALATTITVIDSISSPAVTYAGIDTVNFTGNATLTAGGTPNVVNVDIGSGGGGGGTTLKYGKITAKTKGTYAIWQYTVQLYSAGVSGASVTAYNLAEIANSASIAYGYSVTGAGYDKISGTNYYIREVPVNTWVRLEYTNDPDGTAVGLAVGASAYWFNAANRIDGGC